MKTKAELIEKLQADLLELSAFFHQEELKHIVAYYEQSIDLHANVETLTRVIVEVEKHLLHLREKP